MRKDRRFHWIVNEFQGKLLWRFVMYWVIYQFTLWNIMFCWQVLQEGKGNVLEQYGRFVVAQYPVLLCLVVLIPFFAWDAIRFSLRVAEPLHRIRTTIQGIESGRKLRTVKLRKGDYLQEVIDDLNSLILHLEERSLVTLDSTLSGSSQSVVERAGIARTSTQDNQGSRAVSHAV